MSNRTILLIDYDPQSIQSAIKPLENAGFRVEVANDGVSGLQAFERLHPDLVLIEPMVPKKHGFEVCQEIKGSSQGRTVPVLITTGFYRGRKHQLEAKQFYGCDEYLEKPIAEDLLVSTCQKYLGDDAEGPRLLEDLAVGLDTSREVTAEALPALEELSEDEIVARLDALIKEEPELFEEDPAPAVAEAPQPAVAEGAVVFETESAQSPGSPAPVPEAVEQPTAAPAEAEIETVPLQIPATGPVRRTESAARPARAPERAGRDAAPRAPRRAKADRTAKTPEVLAVPRRRRRGRTWVFAAAAGILVAAGAGVVLGPRLLRGEITPASAATASRPAHAREAAGERNPAAPSALPAQAGPAEAEPGGVEVLPADAGPAAATPGEPAAGRAERVTESAARPSPDPTAPSSGTRVPERNQAATGSDSAEPAPAKPVVTPSRRVDEAPAGETRRAASPPPPTEGQAALSKPKPERRPDEGADREIRPTRAPSEAAAPAVETPAEAAPSPATVPMTTSTEGAEAAQPETAGPSEALPSSEPEAESGPATAPGEATADTVAGAPAEREPVQPPPVVRGTLLDVSQVDVLPEALDKPAPEYPPLARRMRIDGAVTMRVLVDDSGRVQAVETISKGTNDLLTKAAEQSARRWTYRPATKDGVPVKVWLVERVVFQL